MVPPELSFDYVDLPLTRLHIMVCGSGEPLIVVPATISELDNWRGLVQFLGQRYKTYFFELPGHGKSTPFKKPFSSEQVVQTIEHLADHIKADRFNLMGFSFGGLLALKAFNRLEKRIDKVVFLAPCVTHEAVKYSPYRMSIVKTLEKIFSQPVIRRQMMKLMHNEKTVDWIVKLLVRLGKIEKNSKLREKLLILPESTVEVLDEQVKEILSVKFEKPKKKFAHKCFFAMSVYDPLLDYNVTLKNLEYHFSDLLVQKLYLPYHQPPEPFTFNQLNEEFGDFLYYLD